MIGLQGLHEALLNEIGSQLRVAGPGAGKPDKSIKVMKKRIRNHATP